MHVKKWFYTYELSNIISLADLITFLSGVICYSINGQSLFVLRFKCSAKYYQTSDNPLISCDKKVSEYDKEMPQSHTANQPTACEEEPQNI